MTTTSALTGPALHASRAALTAALADQSVSSSTAQEELEPGEIQEIDMETQADSIRTVFSDPTNFNVKVRSLVEI
jgi:translation initiation factor 4E